MNHASVYRTQLRSADATQQFTVCLECVVFDITRPHRSATYVEMQAIVTDVARSVCLSVCLSVTIVSPAKTAEPIKIPFELWTHGV